MRHTAELLLTDDVTGSREGFVRVTVAQRADSKADGSQPDVREC